MVEQISKSQLFEKIRNRQAEFEELLAPLSETQMITTGVTGAWSIKDIVAHLNAWQSVLLNRLRAAATGGEPTVPQNYNVDDMNERFYQENKARSLPDVMAEFRYNYQKILEAVALLSEDDLNNPHRYSWWDGEPFWPNIAGDTYEHIDEHIVSIQQWLAGNK